MQTMNPNEIKTHTTFSELFPINPELLKRIEQDIRDKTYDFSQPIILATWEGQDDPVCIDGHTRLKAAINAGIADVPVWIREDFATEDEALEHAIKLQRNRRNMTDAELISCFEKLDQRKQRGGDRKSEDAKSKPQHCGNAGGRSASAREIAEKLGISTRKAEQTRTVIDHADPDIAEAVRNSEMSINKAYKETQKRRKEAESQESENQGQDIDDEDLPEPDESGTDEDEEDYEELGQDDTEDDSSEDEDETDESDDDDCEVWDKRHTEKKPFMVVRISLEQYQALDEWTGEDSIEELVEQAIDRYLNELEEEYADSADDLEHEE
jgi:ParB-like chromosome segregation protein Spo0J